VALSVAGEALIRQTRIYRRIRPYMRQSGRSE
jgi:hypothetical protein